MSQPRLGRRAVNLEIIKNWDHPFKMLAFFFGGGGGG